MKAKILTTIGCLLLMAGFLHSQTPVASFSLVDNSSNTSGTYNRNDSFTLTLMGTTNYVSNGFSMWLETNSGLAPFISITGETYTAFTNPQDNGFPKAFTDPTGADSGFLTDTDTVLNPQTNTLDSGDNGATGATHAAGTFELAKITFQLSNAPLGVWSLKTTTGGGTNAKSSEINDASPLQRVAAPSATYTITVVPEPATLSLLALSGLGSFGLNVLRRRRRS